MIFILKHGAWGLRAPIITIIGRITDEKSTLDAKNSAILKNVNMAPLIPIRLNGPRDECCCRYGK